VVGAGDRPGHVLRPDREVRPHRVVTREPLEVPAGQKRLVDELAAVLLADQNDQRSSAVPRVGDCVDGIAQPRGGVQIDQRRLPPRKCVPGRHPDHRALVEREHELDVGGQRGQERDLGRPRVTEDRRHPEFAHDVKRGVTHRPLGGHGANVSRAR